MKYHSNITTVLISIAVLLLFVAASGMILFEMNLTSPTMIVAENIFKDFTSQDSDFKFSFSNVERNLRDRVRISNLDVTYKEQPLASFDALEIKLSFLDLVSYILTGKNDAKIALSNGVITIPQSMLSMPSNGNDSEKGTVEGFTFSDIKLPEILEKYRFQIDFDSFVLKVGDIAEFQDVAASIGLKGSLETLDIALFIPKFSFNYGEYHSDLDFIGFTFAYENEYVLKAMVDDLAVSSTLLNANAKDFFLSFHVNEDEILSLENLRGRLGFDSLNGNYDRINVGLNDVSFSFDRNIKTLGFTGISADMDNYSLSVLDARIKTSDFDHYEATISEVDGTDAVLVLAAKDMDGKVSLSDKTGSLEWNNVKASNLNALTGVVQDLELKKLSLKGAIKDNYSVSYSFNASSNPISDIFTAFRFTSMGEFEFTSDDLKHMDVTISNIYPGVGVELGSLGIEGDLNSAQYHLNYGASLSTDGQLSVSSRKLNGTLDFFGLRLHDFDSILGANKEIIGNITNLDTKLVGKISYAGELDASTKYGVRFDTDFDLFLNGIHYNRLTSDFGLKGRFIKEDSSVVFPTLELVSNYVMAKFNGVLDLDEMLPDMNYEVALPNGTILLKGDLNLANEREYHYKALIPRFTNSYIEGDVDFKQQDAIKVRSDLKTGRTMREFEMDINLPGRTILLESPKILVEGSYADGIKLSASFNHLDTVVDGYGKPIFFDGRFIADFDKGGKFFSLKTNDFSISDIWFFPSRPTLFFDLDGNEDVIAFNNIVVQAAEDYAFLGQSKYEFDKKSFTIRLDEKRSDGQILMSIFKDEGFSGIFRGENLDLTTFGFNGMVGNINLSGRAAKLQDFTFTGNIEALSTDTNNDNRKLTGKISIDPTYIAVRDLAFTNTGVDASIASIDYNAEIGDFAVSDISFYLKNEHKDRDYPIKGALDIHGKLMPQDSIYSAVFNTMRNRGEGVSLGINLKNLDLDNSVIIVSDKSTWGSIKNGVLELEGNLANGSVNLNDFRTKVGLDVLPLAKLDLDLNIKDGIAGKIDVHGFNMYVFNFFFQAPLLVFKENMLFGEVGIAETNEGYNLNGNLSADELSLEIFWAPDQLVTLHKPSFTVWNNDVRTSLTPTTVLNYNDYTRNAMNMIVAIGFSPSLSFEGYEAEMFIDDDNVVDVRVPLPDTNIDIFGKLNGHYKFTGYNGKVTNDGILNLYDTTISIGMFPYPEWYGLTGEMFIDLVFNFTKNNKIIYPAGPNPMVSIVVADNNTLDFHLGRDGIKVGGDLKTRGGEIFYFNKYFYIVDGQIGFPDKEKLDPRISLRASLRDFDANGEKVEIYLVIKNSSFTNLNPTFESTPQKDISEIMSILGQSILSSSTYGTVSASSMASLVTESMDVLSKLGIIKSSNASANLNNSMKEIMKLDTFSIHSNIVNNIVSDTIASASLSNIEMFSPMARYLNGTTLNLGKYLSPNLYFQAMMHLDATKRKDAYKVFADDLALETELSLEWVNDAFTVTFFSNPKYLSFYSLFDTFGFTIMKTIKF